MAVSESNQLFAIGGLQITRLWKRAATAEFSSTELDQPVQ